MHNMGEFEYQNEWARVWLDLGTSDAVAIDILINALRTLDRDLLQIEEIFIGGINEGWPVEESDDRFFEN
jgi:inactivated superfamily I helicase